MKNKIKSKNGEKEAVFTTIVGGRPPGSGTSLGAIPRGIEVLLKKASVDPEFRKLLISMRSKSAETIGLEISSAEAAILDSVPPEQLNSIIERTVVLPEHRNIFLGKVAALMLMAIGMLGAPAGCKTNNNEDNIQSNLQGNERTPITSDEHEEYEGYNQLITKGIRPDHPNSPVRGIRPDNPNKEYNEQKNEKSNTE